MRVRERGGTGSDNVQQLLGNRPELTGNTRDKLLSTVQSLDLYNIINELYRPGATVQIPAHPTTHSAKN